MAQVKIYGLRSTLAPIRTLLSDTVHRCIVDVLKFPVNKRAHRFIMLDKEDFFMPEGRTEQYIIIEIMMMEGRTADTRKNLIRRLFHEIGSALNISATDIEICLLESPAHNWGFRGKTGDEAEIGYRVDV